MMLKIAVNVERLVGLIKNAKMENVLAKSSAYYSSDLESQKDSNNCGTCGNKCSEEKECNSAKCVCKSPTT